MYDFANSAYNSLVPVLLFPLYYKTIILQSSPYADLWWGIAVGISVLLSGLISPIIGAIADLSNKRKLAFVLSSLATIVGIFLLALSSSLSPLLATILFILTNLSSGVALTLYDALLSSVAGDKLGKVSGLGYGIGYAGGILCTLLVYPLFQAGVESSWYWLGFVIVALFYLVFSLPAFIFLKEEEFSHEKRKAGILRSSFSSTFHTLKSWKENRKIFRFLFAFYFLTEGIVTLMYFISLFASTTLGLTATQIALVFILSQVIAIPATILIGHHSEKIGYRKILILTLMGWCITTVLLSVTNSLTMLYLVGAFTGLIIGSSQATARAWFAQIIPAQKKSELFGFNALASKISATIGPPIFGIISVATGNQRIAVVTIVVYFLISLFLFYRQR